MLRDSTVAVIVVVVRTRPRAIPLAMIHMRKSIHGFPFVPLYGYGAPLGGRSRRSSAIKTMIVVVIGDVLGKVPFSRLFPQVPVGYFFFILFYYFFNFFFMKAKIVTT